MIGHVTSAYWSETLQRSIAMAVVEGGRARMGAELYVPMADGVHPVQVVEPVFYDPEGGRLNV
jgi:sarcosine oxidase subunit alpha